MTVWYNPTQDFVGNALSYAWLFDQIFIVDNTEGDNSTLASQIPNAIYIPNGKNLGIAKALNQGIEAALIENTKGRDYHWVMTMDQDSAWEKDQLTQYISLCIEMHGHDEAIKSFSPNVITVSFAQHSTVGIWKRKLYRLITRKEYKEKFADTTKPQFGFTNVVLTSGNVIEIKAWEEVGKFDEVLFIGLVDTEFCYRLREAKYKIFKIEHIRFMHQTNNAKPKTFLPHYNPSRLYYALRNSFYVTKKHPQYHNNKSAIKMAKLLIFNLPTSFPALVTLIRAYKDYKQALLPLLKGEH